MTAGHRPTAGRSTTGRRVGTAVSGTVLVICNLVTLLYTVLAWLAVPASIGDTNLIEGAWYTAFLGTVLAVVTAVLTVLPVTARWLGLRWLIVPAVLFVVATARWMYIDHAYPDWAENLQSGTSPMSTGDDQRTAIG